VSTSTLHAGRQPRWVLRIGGVACRAWNIGMSFAPTRRLLRPVKTAAPKGMSPRLPLSPVWSKGYGSNATAGGGRNQTWQSALSPEVAAVSLASPTCRALRTVAAGRQIRAAQLRYDGFTVVSQGGTSMDIKSVVFVLAIIILIAGVRGTWRPAPRPQQAQSHWPRRRRTRHRQSLLRNYQRGTAEFRSQGRRSAARAQLNLSRFQALQSLLRSRSPER
jgi:hypothetical protein